MSLYNKIIDLQKLNMAWKRVKMNKPSPGVDGVTWDVYDASASEENKRLQRNLRKRLMNASRSRVLPSIRKRRSAR